MSHAFRPPLVKTWTYGIFNVSDDLSKDSNLVIFDLSACCALEGETERIESAQSSVDGTT